MITINKDRTAYIPESDRHIGFENDNLAETRYFEITDEETANFSFKLDIAETLDIIDLEKVTLDDGKCVLLWKITAAAIGDGGIIKAQLRAFDETGEKVWHSQIMEFVADESINGEKQIVDERILSEFEQLEIRATNAVSNAEKAAASAESCAENAVAAKEKAATSERNADTYCSSAKEYCENAGVYAENASQSEKNIVSAIEDFEKNFISSEEQLNKAESHYSAKDNPHTVTASQIGAYTKEETDALLAEKASKDDYYETVSFEITDLDYTIGGESYDYNYFIGTNYVTSPFTNAVTIHCKGEILGFTAFALENDSNFSYAKLKVNGEYVIDNINGALSYSIEPTLMTEDIVVELLSDTVYFSDMKRKLVKGYSDLERTIGDIDTALDEIITIQQTLINGENVAVAEN